MRADGEPIHSYGRHGTGSMTQLDLPNEAEKVAKAYVKPDDSYAYE